MAYLKILDAIACKPGCTMYTTSSARMITMASIEEAAWAVRVMVHASRENLPTMAEENLTLEINETSPVEVVRVTPRCQQQWRGC